jgi:hypothetical protein
MIVGVVVTSFKQGNTGGRPALGRQLCLFLNFHKTLDSNFYQANKLTGSMV